MCNYFFVNRILFCFRIPSIVILGLSAGKFVDLSDTNTNSLRNFLSSSISSQMSQVDALRSVLSTPTRNTGEIFQHELDENLASRDEHTESGDVSVMSNNGLDGSDKSELRPSQHTVSHTPSTRHFVKTASCTLKNEATRFPQNLFTMGKSSDSASNSISFSEEDLVTCDKCQSRVSAWVLPEHLDYHVALELQREDRSEHAAATQSTARTMTASGTPSKTTNGRNVKRKPVDSKSQSRSKKSSSTTASTKTLDSYFQKPISKK